MDQNQKIILITGASRGVGKGTALGLANPGNIVYITGRSRHEGDTTDLPGTLEKTAEEVRERGAQCVPVFCDHSNTNQIESLFTQINSEQGKLDLLVNNVYQVPEDLLEWKPFWERPLESHWNAMMDVGLRAHYIASQHAARMMVRQASGAIVTVASPAVNVYIHSVIYGMGKAAKDKMTQDMAKELSEHGVAAFGLWPGIVKSERLQPALDANLLPPEYEALKPGMESPEFTGRILQAILENNKAQYLSGRSWWNSELGMELGVKDVDGHQPVSYAEMMGQPAEVNPVMVR